MSAARLDLALATGGLGLPEGGTVVVFGPRAGLDLSALPKDRVLVVTGQAPDNAWFREAGYACAASATASTTAAATATGSTAATGRFAAAVVILPRAKALAQAWIAQAARLTDGPVVVDGGRVDGIDSILKAVRQRTAVSGPVNKAHGKLFWFDGPAGAEALADWRGDGPAMVEGGWTTAPGVFSADGVDPASALLADALPANMGGHVVDLGAGWGYLAARLLARKDITRLDLVEADQTALDCARVNVVDERARFHWADATRWRPDRAADTVITNPPFHQTRAAAPDLGRGFIAAAARMVRPGGRLWLVANRHLPYEDAVRDTFGTCEEREGSRSFKILTATLAPRHTQRNRVS